MNILIAEDDKIQRENLRKMLESINSTFNIYEAEEKLQSIKRDKIILVISHNDKILDIADNVINLNLVNNIIIN